MPHLQGGREYRVLNSSARFPTGQCKCEFAMPAPVYDCPAAQGTDGAAQRYPLCEGCAEAVFTARPLLVTLKSKHGLIGYTTVTKVTLFEKTVVTSPAPLRRPVSARSPAAVSQPPPAAGSYAATLAEGVARRKAQQSAQSLNHRPRKAPRADTSELDGRG